MVFPLLWTRTPRIPNNVYHAPGIMSRMRLYDWTGGSTVLTEIGPSAPLIDSHIYRMTIHTRMSGFHDPTEIVNDLTFSDARITIADQPILCLLNDFRTHSD